MSLKEVMTLDSGFDTINQSHAIIEQVQDAAWHGKEELLKAPTEKEFSLHGLKEENIIEVPIIGGNQIAMPKMEPGKLSFNTMNLLIGILAGDYAESGNNEVNIYYPLMQTGKLTGKIVFKMNLPEAAILLKKTAAIHQIDAGQIKHAALGMISRFTFGDETSSIHKNDISIGLSQEI